MLPNKLKDDRGEYNSLKAEKIEDNLRFTNQI